MAVPLGTPRVSQQDENGLPAVGWKLHVYEVGTLDNKTSYSDADLTTANANPVILDSLGMASVFYNGRAKLVMKNASDVTQWEEPDISVNPVDPAEWIGAQDASFTSGTSFTVSGNQTTILHLDRRMKLIGGFGTIYGSITSSSYSSPLTTVTLAVDSGTMDNTLTTAQYATLSADNPSHPGNIVTLTGTQTLTNKDLSSGTNTLPATVVGKYKTNSEQKLTTSALDDDALFGYVLPVDNYLVEGALMVLSSSATPDFQCTFQVVSGTITANGLNYYGNDGTNTDTWSGVAFTSVATFPIAASSLAKYITISGFISVTAEATIDFQWGPILTDPAGTTVDKGAFIKFTKI